MSVSNTIFVTGSIFLFLSFLAVGISFFAPYWLSNLASIDNADVIWLNKSIYVADVEDYPDRGLWAQCGVQCIWFWTRDYVLQVNVFTPLKWHLATQILYFIAATITLFTIIQTAAVAVFGGGASRYPYNAISNPTEFTKYLGQASTNPYTKVYLGWCFWMAVVGDMLTVVAAILFLVSWILFDK